MIERRRAAINIVIPGKIFQRGKVLTWTREAKVKAFAELGIKSVINFWPKVDPDLGEMGLDWFWQISCPRSDQMLEPRVMQAAEAVADYLWAKENNVLVLCEAGKTRSVFFCILLVSLIKDLPYDEARTYVLEKVSGASLKGFMDKWFKEQDSK